MITSEEIKCFHVGLENPMLLVIARQACAIKIKKRGVGS